jgi:hypothetical protein
VPGVGLDGTGTPGAWHVHAGDQVCAHWHVNVLAHGCGVMVHDGASAH